MNHIFFRLSWLFLLLISCDPIDNFPNSSSSNPNTSSTQTPLSSEKQESSSSLNTSINTSHSKIYNETSYEFDSTYTYGDTIISNGPMDSTFYRVLDSIFTILNDGDTSIVSDSTIKILKSKNPYWYYTRCGNIAFNMQYFTNFCGNQVDTLHKFDSVYISDTNSNCNLRQTHFKNLQFNIIKSVESKKYFSSTYTVYNCTKNTINFHTSEYSNAFSNMYFTTKTTIEKGTKVIIFNDDISPNSSCPDLY